MEKKIIEKISVLFVMMLVISSVFSSLSIVNVVSEINEESTFTLTSAIENQDLLINSISEEIQDPLPIIGFDLVADEFYLSSVPSDWNKEHVVTNPNAGDEVYIHWIYSILGSGSVNPFYWRVRLKIQGGSEIFDVEEQVTDPQYLQAGYYYPHCFTNPWHAPGGDYKLELWVDSQYDISEDDENNNYVDNDFSVTPTGEKFDMKANDVWLSSEPADYEQDHLVYSPFDAGTEIYFHFQWIIYGNPGTLVDPYYIKMDLIGPDGFLVEDIIDEEDSRRAGYIITAYLSDDQSNGWFSVAGDYTLTCTVDSQDDVNEWTENNNEITTQFTVESSGTNIPVPGSVSSSVGPSGSWYGTMDMPSGPWFLRIDLIAPSNADSSFLSPFVTDPNGVRHGAFLLGGGGEPEKYSGPSKPQYFFFWGPIPGTWEIEIQNTNLFWEISFTIETKINEGEIHREFFWTAEGILVWPSFIDYTQPDGTHFEPEDTKRVCVTIGGTEGNSLKGSGAVTIAVPKGKAIIMTDQIENCFWNINFEPMDYEGVLSTLWLLEFIDLITFSWTPDLLGLFQIALEDILNIVGWLQSTRDYDYGSGPDGSVWTDTENYDVYSFAYTTGSLLGLSCNRQQVKFPIYFLDDESIIPINIHTTYTWWDGSWTQKNVGDEETIIFFPYPDNNPPDIPSRPSGPSSGPVGESVGPYTTSTTDPDGDEVIFGWDWDGDDIVDEWSEWYENNPSDSRSHTWENPGTYNVQVLANDGCVMSEFSQARTVTISYQTPTANAGGPYSVKKGETIYFDGTDSHDNDEGGQSIVRYDWDFGEGSGWHNDIGSNPEWEYNIKDTYSITLKVYDDEGEIDTDTAEVAVTHSNPTCFLAETQVTMADGTYKNIEDVVVGDMILSCDRYRGTTKQVMVSKIFHHTPDEMGDYYLIINGDLRITPNHLLFIDGLWRYAEDVLVGDCLLGVDGKYSEIVSIEQVFESVPTYNFAVDSGMLGSHTCFAQGSLMTTKKDVVSVIVQEFILHSRLSYKQLLTV